MDDPYNPTNSDMDISEGEMNRKCQRFEECEALQRMIDFEQSLERRRESEREREEEVGKTSLPAR
jgi:hypothetical protein